MSWFSAAFWVAVLAAPACWVWGGIALVGTPNRDRFVHAYPSWVTLCTAAAALTLLWAPWPSDAGFAFFLLVWVVWLCLVGPVATLVQVVLIHRWRP